MSEKLTPLERARAFREVFGTGKTRSRAQEIVYRELCGQFMLTPTFQVIPGVGVDTHLAAVISGKVEVAKTIFDNINTPDAQLTNAGPTVTRSKDEMAADDED